jgi:hypothetical protein
VEYLNVDGFCIVDGTRLVTRAEYLIGLPKPSRLNTLEYAVAYAFAEMADRTGLIKDYHPPRLVEGGHLLKGLEVAMGREIRNVPTYDTFTIIALARFESYLTSIGYLGWV